MYIVILGLRMDSVGWCSWGDFPGFKVGSVGSGLHSTMEEGTMGARKNQASLTVAEWRAFIAAINAMHGMGIPAPRYRDFVRVHVDAMTTVAGMTWGVHTMPSMGSVGRNFLAWHRQFLVRLERRLQVVDPGVSVPYWDWIAQPDLPKGLGDAAQLREWGVTRSWTPALLPTSGEVAAVLNRADFIGFQRFLEAIHNPVHDAVGGAMATAASPTDPLFWLHHANIDRLWAEWQAHHPGAPPPNATEVLLPRRVGGHPMFGIRVSAVLDIATLGYRYQ